VKQGREMKRKVPEPPAVGDLVIQRSIASRAAMILNNVTDFVDLLSGAQTERSKEEL
jgi:hypothetical protein